MHAASAIRRGLWSAPFTPKRLSGLVLWLDAGTLSGADGDAVATWSDLSGLSNHVTQATGAKQPVVKHAILNGRKVVRFDGTDDILHKADAASLDISTGFTWFFVGKRVGTGNDMFFIKQGDNATAEAVYGSGVVDADSKNLNSFRVDAEAWADVVTGTNAMVDDTFAIVAGAYDGANAYLFKDGAANGSAAKTGSITNSTGNFSVGGYDAAFSGSEYLNGDIAELILYNRALSATDRRRVEGYLGKKYGIAVTA